jgi:hypothetical protein
MPSAPRRSSPSPVPLPPCDCNSCKDIQADAGKLPSPKNCKNEGDAACNGWKPQGTLDNTDDISGAQLNKAALFVKDITTDCGAFKCMYLPRYNEPRPPNNMLHGLLCFSTSGCNACAYDLDKKQDDPHG